MKISISTVGSTSKVIYNGMVLAQLDEMDLESLRADIWVALQEMDLAREQAREYEAEAVS